MSISIVQITDLHLFADRAGVLAGVNTWETFEAVLARIDAHHGDYDYLLVTGDIAQDEAAETYLRLRDALGARLERCRLIPGNHDNRGYLQAAFPQQVANGNGALDFHLSHGGYSIIGLDTQLTGEVYGCLDEAQLDWLRNVLADNQQPTAVFMHHPPLPIKVDWLDKPAFVNSEPLMALLDASPHVKTVCAGHVHQDFSANIGGTAFYSTPSTCVQFASRGDARYDTSAAGYRSLRLDADGHTTQVYRLA